MLRFLLKLADTFFDCVLLQSLSSLLIVSQLFYKTLLLFSDLRQVDLHLVVSWGDAGPRGSSFGLISGSHRRPLPVSRVLRSLILSLLLLVLDRVPRSFLKLSETHLRTFRVLFEDSLIGLLPLVEDVLQTVISLSLSPIDQVSDL